MRKRLWQSFVCLAALGIATGVMALFAINQQANEFNRASSQTLAAEEWVRDSLRQQLGLERLRQDWAELSPLERKNLIIEMRARQQRLVDELAPPTERDMAIGVLQGLDSLQSELKQGPGSELTRLTQTSRDLAIRLSSLGASESQQRFSALEKRRWQLNITVMFLSLLFILCSQYLAWMLLGRHFIRPLIHLGKELDALTGHRSDTEPKLETVNRELKGMSDNLKHIHHQLQHQSRNSDKDPVTGLASRKALNQHLQQEWLRGLRAEGPVSLLLLAVDPVCNHDGDARLGLPDPTLQQLVAIACQHTARAQDFLARFDANRLAIVLAGTDLEQAIKLAHQLCHKVNQARISAPLLASQPWITVSVGIANHIPKRPHGWDKLVQEAEEALDKAHSQGGNQAAVAPCHLPDTDWLKQAANR
ncbi:diguanylate cyclase [Shewanella sp. JM162201]|uniref:diguanylate cyclase n=1 Tax=Shewanella jiangmenensis TaxID=2837387 RepID=A0ABS5V2W4_9GAMM|nr:diguanylate cyclase [Shewanella jiangmenensis]MBT1444786.1 diguanylate cyclase [Shewanella jiangmenensis]